MRLLLDRSEMSLAVATHTHTLSTKLFHVAPAAAAAAVAAAHNCFFSAAAAWIEEIELNNITHSNFKRLVARYFYQQPLDIIAVIISRRNLTTSRL